MTGDWKGTFDMNGSPMELKFHLKSTGNAVSGTMERPGAPPSEVHEGKIEGDTVSFWITTDYEGNRTRSCTRERSRRGRSTSISALPTRAGARGYGEEKLKRQGPGTEKTGTKGPREQEDRDRGDGDQGSPGRV